MFEGLPQHLNLPIGLSVFCPKRNSWTELGDKRLASIVTSINQGQESVIQLDGTFYSPEAWHQAFEGHRIVGVLSDPVTWLKVTRNEIEGLVVCTGIDVSNTIQSYIALESQFNGIRQILESNKDIIYLLDNSGEIQYISNYTKDQTACVHPEDAPFCKAVVDEVLSKGIAKTGVKYRVLDPQSGEWRWFTSSISRVTGPVDQGTCVLGVARDVTALEVTSQRLKETQTLLNTVIQNSPTTVHFIDHRGFIVLLEGRGIQRMNIDPQKVLHRHYHWVYEDTPEVIASIDKAMKGEECRWSFQWNGRHFESHLVPLQEDSITGVIGITTEITELVQKAKELQNFAYIASHDLREPLRMIHNYLELLVHHYSSNLDERSMGYINQVTEASKRMQLLIDDLLSYSRVSFNHATPSPISLRHVMEVVETNLSVLIKDLNAQFSFPSSDAVIMADQTHAIQLFQNLVSNGMKFSESSPKVEVNWKTNADHVLITVKDNGIGIEHKFHEHIFLPFKRLNNNYPGTGIGLSICQKVVERYEGTIWLDSKVGEGTTFYIKMPTSKVN